MMNGKNEELGLFVNLMKSEGSMIETLFGICYGCTKVYMVVHERRFAN